MPPRVLIARLAQGAMGGQQIAEAHLMDALRAVIAGEPTSLRLVERTVASLRAPVGADVRLPLGRLDAMPWLTPLMSRLVYAGADLVHRQDLRLPPAPGEVVTVHDLGFLHFQDEASPGRYWREHLLRARAVVTVSEFSAAEVRTALGGRVPVHVIPNGVAAAFTTTSPPDAATARRLRLPAHYVLHLGGVTRRKNLGALVEAWRIVHAGFPDVVLAMAGPDDPRRISAAGRTPGIVLLGVLPPAHLPSVVAGAAAVVVPSLYEGFGLPLLEAMAAGIPVVASARAALPEVAGGDAVLVEPTAEGLAEGLALVLEGGTALEARVRAGVERAATFSWERAARAHLRLYLSLLSTTP